MSISNFTIKKNKHFSRPFKLILKYKPKLLTWVASFTDNCIYDLRTVDQRDWNKLCGVSYSIPSNYNAAMIGWRYNPNSRMFELCGYVNDNYSFSTTPILAEVSPDDIVHCEIKVDYKNKKYHFEIYNATQELIETASMDFIHKCKLARLVHPYFGGNTKAPHTMNIFLNTVR